MAKALLNSGVDLREPAGSTVALRLRKQIVELEAELAAARAVHAEATALAQLQAEVRDLTASNRRMELSLREMMIGQHDRSDVDSSTRRLPEPGRKGGRRRGGRLLPELIGLGSILDVGGTASAKALEALYEDIYGP